MKPRHHKTQHWVPRSYLDAWRDPDTPVGQEPYVHVFSRDGQKHRRKAPANLFTERELYTIKLEDGGRDLRLEHGLSGLEDAFRRIRADYIEPRRQLPLPRYVKLMIFLAAMHARTPAMRDHHMKFWREVQDQGEQIERWAKTATVQEKERAARASVRSSGTRSFGMDQVRAITASPMQSTLGPFISAEAPLLLKMRCIVICTDTDPGFITSDHPVVWFDSEWHKKPPMFRSPSFSDPELEITMPLSPGQLLMMRHGKAEGAHRVEYFDLDAEVVCDLNRRSRFSCTNEFVVRREHSDPRWFDPGVEPGDS